MEATTPPPVLTWGVRIKTGEKIVDKKGITFVRVVAELTYGGSGAYFKLSGPTAEKSMNELAVRLNARGETPPPHSAAGQSGRNPT